MKTETKIKPVICIHICTKQMKIKSFISGTCGRIELDVSDVNSGLHMSLFGSINSRKAANEERQVTLKREWFHVQNFKQNKCVVS